MPSTRAVPAASPRRPFAAGDFITRYSAGGSCALRIDCPFEKPGWRAREEASPPRPVFPGTAVELEGEWYEVRRAEPLPGDRVGYFLDPWDDAFPLRAPVVYDEAACERWAQERWQRQRRERLEMPVLLAAPFIGLAPAALQRQVEGSTGVRATTLTFASAASVLAVTAPLTVLASVAGFAAAFGAADADLGWIAAWRLVWIVLAAESFVRLASGWSGGEPMGSLLGMPLLLVPRFRRAVRAGALATAAPPAAPAASAGERDERRRAAAQTWVDTLRPLWGLLRHDTQERLARTFRFDPAAATRESTIGTGLFGAGAGLLALRYLVAGGGLADLAMLVVGIVLLVETVRRRRSPNAVAASVVAPLVQPFAVRLLGDLPELPQPAATGIASTATAGPM